MPSIFYQILKCKSLGTILELQRYLMTMESIWLRFDISILTHNARGVNSYVLLLFSLISNPELINVMNSF